MSNSKHLCTTIADIRNIAKKTPNITISESDKQTFKNGEYETFKLTEPLMACRYFGAVSDDEISSIRAQATNDGIEKDWGSDAGGRFLGLNPNLSSQEAKERMALKSDWGNSEAYLATIEISVGTEICVGIVGEQIDLDGKILPGGEVQILLPDPMVTEKTDEKQYAWTTEKTQQWIKKCEPVVPKETDDLSFVSDHGEFEIFESLKTEEQELPEPLYFEEVEESTMPNIEAAERSDDIDAETLEAPENQVKENIDNESKNIM